jgi:hypothetical protein
VRGLRIERGRGGHPAQVSTHDPSTDHRAHPELYRVARGEQGVLTVQPYKDELLPLWRFATPDKARESAAALTERFEGYLADGDLVGADMARKFLQMGFTRARRYANHPGGRKHAEDGSELPRGEEDPVKAESARIFKQAWDRVEQDATYTSLRDEHRRRFG